MDNEKDKFSQLSVTIPSIVEMFNKHRSEKIEAEEEVLKEFFSILLTDSQITEYDMAVKYGFPYNARLEVAKHLYTVICTLREANGFFVHDVDKFTTKEIRTYRKILKSVSRMYKRLYKKMKQVE